MMITRPDPNSTLTIHVPFEPTRHLKPRVLKPSYFFYGSGEKSGRLNLEQDVKRYQAILFDFDGVLARTMEDNFRAWSHALASVGIMLEPEQYFLEEGRTARDYVNSVLTREQADRGLAANIIKIKNDYYSRNSSFSFYEGVEDIVPALESQGFRLGLVSGGSYARICCQATKSLLSHFDVVITGDEMLHCKPAPDPYLLAASRLNLTPEQCLVVENAPLGIESAKRAGMDCIAISSTLDPKYLVHADRVISDVREVRSLIRF